ncbi:PH domain-containing protein [Amnibacterium sp.]|uniref:PH domain-containing protein n=1 Tax=Amnibacterium sp. TaxID=1872496 RepID=UPI003F7C53A0
MRTERRPTSAPPPREAPEQVIVRLRRSGRHLVWPAIFFIAIAFGTGYWWQRMPAAWLNTALPIVAAGLTVLLSVLPLVFWLNRLTVITTRRLIVTQGFLVRERTEFSLSRASDAVLRRRPLQLLTGSGDVIVHAGAEGTMILRDVPRAKLVHRAIAELIERGAAG